MTWGKVIFGSLLVGVGLAIGQKLVDVAWRKAFP